MKKESKYKVTVAHVETSDRKPVATTAHVVDKDGNMAIGIAICSPRDRFNGKIGRKIALGRAFYAMANESSCREVSRYEAVSQLAKAGRFFKHKCMYVPIISGIAV